MDFPAANHVRIVGFIWSELKSEVVL